MQISDNCVELPEFSEVFVTSAGYIPDVPLCHGTVWHRLRSIVQYPRHHVGTVLVRPMFTGLQPASRPYGRGNI